MQQQPRKHPFIFAGRVMQLLLTPNNTSCFVNQSYDRIAAGYDTTWTQHMRDLTTDLITRINIHDDTAAIDLTCGTGFATGLIAQRTNQTVTGIDASSGMLNKARENYPDCNFIQSDILEYLKTLNDNSLDLITCCWGLGYSKPFAIVRQIKRILKPCGTVAIIDNTIFSLREIMQCSALTFMEQPDKLKNLMRFSFLTGSNQLGTYYRILGLKPNYLASGKRTFNVDSGAAAIEKLRTTGAAAGFEYAAEDADSSEIYDRFAQIIEQKYPDKNIPVTHRYLTGIATKC